MKLRTILLTETTPEERAQQEVLDAVNTVLSNITDSMIRIKAGSKAGKGYYQKELKLLERQINNTREMLIKTSDSILRDMTNK